MQLNLLDIVGMINKWLWLLDNLPDDTYALIKCIGDSDYDCISANYSTIESPIYQITDDSILVSIRIRETCDLIRFNNLRLFKNKLGIRNSISCSRGSSNC